MPAASRRSSHAAAVDSAGALDVTAARIRSLTASSSPETNANGSTPARCGAWLAGGAGCACALAPAGSSAASAAGVKNRAAAAGSHVDACRVHGGGGACRHAEAVDAAAPAARRSSIATNARRGHVKEHGRVTARARHCAARRNVDDEDKRSLSALCNSYTFEACCCSLQQQCGQDVRV